LFKENIMAGSLTISTLNNDTGVLATQNGMTGIAKAWAVFTGGQGNTAGTINGSFNVSSITVNGTGDYTVNFTTAMPNVNYTVFGGCKEDSAGAGFTSNRVVAPRRASNALQTTSVRLGCADFAYAASNVELVFVTILSS
jgi:hypothetical protein